MGAETPQSVETTLAVINTKLDTLLVQRDDHESRLRTIEAVMEAPEDRARRDSELEKLKQFRWVLAGFAIASGGIASTAAQLIR